VEGILALEDGRVYRGRAFGGGGERTGEVVFNTSMTGYQEILSDPSYRGQIVVMTCPEIGNCGTNELDHESALPQVEALVVREVCETPSNWRSTRNLSDYLREHKIPGLTEVDTRAITRNIRTKGALKGIVSSVDRDTDALVRKAKSSPGLEAQDLVRSVTCAAPYRWDAARDQRFRTGSVHNEETALAHCVAYDFGTKHNILRILRECGFDVTVVPATTSAADTLALKPDAIFLSNGPGDPAVATYAIEAVRGLVGRVPMFGICLGHQISALALGAKTFKLKFGHRGANHPVQDVRTGKVAVTSQNHGYSVDPDSLPANVEVTHRNLNDGTCEGFSARDLGLIAVQYHPESSPGPHDSLELFREFREMAAAVPSDRRRPHEGPR